MTTRPSGSSMQETQAHYGLHKRPYGAAGAYLCELRSLALERGHEENNKNKAPWGKQNSSTVRPIEVGERRANQV